MILTGLGEMQLFTEEATRDLTVFAAGSRVRDELAGRDSGAATLCSMLLMFLFLF
jgi:hypothetical protein